MRQDFPLVVGAACTPSVFHFSSQHEQIWTVLPLSTPSIIRKCPRCKSTLFESSDKFRVNASKKIIDVWLIYKCRECDFSWNLTVLSRTSVNKIDRDLFRAFQDNDLALAWRYAFDPARMQAGVQSDWNMGFDIQLQEIERIHVPAEGQRPRMRLQIHSEYFLKIPIVRILRQQWELSRSQLEKMYRAGDLVLYNLQGETLKLNAHLGKRATIEIFQLSG
jgi:hypothetical protein